MSMNEEVIPPVEVGSPVSSYNINCFSKVVRSGKRTYFFDVKENSNGKRYLTITESRQISDQQGNVQGYKKNKVFLHLEDIERFTKALYESTYHLPYASTATYNEETNTARDIANFIL